MLAPASEGGFIIIAAAANITAISANVTAMIIIASRLRFCRLVSGAFPP